MMMQELVYLLQTIWLFVSLFGVIIGGISFFVNLRNSLHKSEKLEEAIKKLQEELINIKMELVRVNGEIKILHKLINGEKGEEGDDSYT